MDTVFSAIGCSSENQSKRSNERDEIFMHQANREYKDSVFRMLFNDKKNLLELYNALNDSSYDNEDDLEINTLKNAIYMNIKNDVSFILNSDMYLFEHQSTVNNNMPLRDLLYISELLGGMVSDMSVYRTKLLKIPTPGFIVFYNGTDDYPEKKILRLSEMFLNETEDPALELKVTVFNINPGCNEALKAASRTLGEYTQFVETVRRHTNGKLTEEDMTAAVDECIENNILRDFLKKNKEGAIKVTLYEFDEEQYLKCLREDCREEGWEAGWEKGREEERANTLREKQRADAAEERVLSAEAEIKRLKEELYELKKQL